MTFKREKFQYGQRGVAVGKQEVKNGRGETGDDG